MCTKTDEHSDLGVLHGAEKEPEYLLLRRSSNIYY